MADKGKRRGGESNGQTRSSHHGPRTTVEIGYSLSSEEHAPNALVRYAQRAEQAGFTFALISDHFHPWTDRQGQSPFVWSVIGAIAHATKQLRLGTGVTCPLIRIHPAIIAQAAATVAAMMPGRFFLGVGTGENLNEHILGDKWYPSDVRREMLREAVSILRQLWEGEQTSVYGEFYTVENARLYTLPEEPPEIYIAAGGASAAELAGEIGDGLIVTGPERELTKAFDHAGGMGKPRYGQVTVCWAQNEAQAKQIAHEWWPIVAIEGELHQELALPAYFEQASQHITPEQVCAEITCGPDPAKHREAIQKYIDAGITHVYVHQIGPDQEGFFKFYEREILPRFQMARA
jgi:G6PDH family F420-dependent oxidoreductase